MGHRGRRILEEEGQTLRMDSFGGTFIWGLLAGHFRLYYTENKSKADKDIIETIRALDYFLNINPYKGNMD